MSDTSQIEPTGEEPRVVDVDALIDLVVVLAGWVCFGIGAWLLAGFGLALGVVGAALFGWVLDWPRPRRLSGQRPRVLRRPGHR